MYLYSYRKKYLALDGTRERLSPELETKYYMDSKSDWHYYPIRLNASVKETPLEKYFS